MSLFIMICQSCLLPRELPNLQRLFPHLPPACLLPLRSLCST